MTDKEIIEKIAIDAGLEPYMLDRSIVQLIKDICLKYPNQRWEWYSMELKANLDPVTAHALRRKNET
jgi:hypothetical protein